jgi:hypothetical protein
LAKILLIEKLVSEITRIKRSHPEIELNLEEDVRLIFGLDFNGRIGDMNERMSSQLK